MQTIKKQIDLYKNQCVRVDAMAKREDRDFSNMARVLIQEALDARKAAKKVAPP